MQSASYLHEVPDRCITSMSATVLDLPAVSHTLALLVEMSAFHSPYASTLNYAYKGHLFAHGTFLLAKVKPLTKSTRHQELHCITWVRAIPTLHLSPSLGVHKFRVLQEADVKENVGWVIRILVSKSCFLWWQVSYKICKVHNYSRIKPDWLLLGSRVHLQSKKKPANSG